MRRGAAAAVALVCALWAPSARGQASEPAPAGGIAISQKLVVLGFDALGTDETKVARLETLFRMELERLAGTNTPTPRDVAKALSRSRRLRRCGGQTKCLTQIGKKLGVDLVITGNIATLGDSHVMNIKVIDVAQGTELRRIASDPLRGDPDELIDAIRVAAYRLLAPEELEGSILILADLDGAQVTLDGKPIGQTPLAEPIGGLTLGHHKLEVTAEGYSPFSKEVLVRFQKSTRVTVNLLADPVGKTQVVQGPTQTTTSHTPGRWYNSTWFLVGAGVAAVVVGGVVGYSLAHDSVVDCGASPEGCR